MKISAILACHNEERFIQAWLEETCTYADEILIAIHAPTDSTANIIAEFKQNSAIPIHCEWFPALTVARYGFSLMKNEMITLATGDWITSIDADEEIGLTRIELQQQLEIATQAGKSAISMIFADHPNPELRNGEWTMRNRKLLRTMHVPLVPVVRKWKVFRRNAGYWWEGMIHEEIRCAGQSSNLFCFETNALLHHYAYLNITVPEWKRSLYAYLICRIRDCPQLRTGTNSWWYEEGFVGGEQTIRAEAALFEAHQHEWCPEIPARRI